MSRNRAMARRSPSARASEEEVSAIGQSWIVRCNNTRISSNKRSCVSTRITCPPLPSDVIFNILLFIPAETLYGVMRFVCKDWYNIINDPAFISAHTRLAPSVFLFEVQFSLPYANFLEVSGGKVNTREELFRSLNARHCRIFASCNGLLLLARYYFDDKPFPPITRSNLFVGNPVTKQLLKLPHLNEIPSPSFSSALGYAPSIRAYKVVTCSANPVRAGPEQLFPCRILTAGVDQSWRLINTELPLSGVDDSETGPIFSGNPFCINGFIYWATDGSTPFIRCLNVDTELFQNLCVPEGYEKKKSVLSPMGDFLAMVSCPEGGILEVWVHKQVTEGGEWTRLLNIDLERIAYLNRYCIENRWEVWPRGWLNGGDFLVLQVPSKNTFILLNVKTQEISWIQLNLRLFNPLCRSHVPSLVSI